MHAHYYGSSELGIRGRLVVVFVILVMILLVEVVGVVVLGSFVLLVDVGYVFIDVVGFSFVLVVVLLVWWLIIF